MPGPDTATPLESLLRPLQDRCAGVGARRATKSSPGGAQVAAEAMPYHMRRRTECNTVRPRPAPSLSQRLRVLALVAPGVSLRSVPLFGRPTR